jgi:hypothetical protein
MILSVKLISLSKTVKHMKSFILEFAYNLHLFDPEVLSKPELNCG